MTGGPGSARDGASRRRRPRRAGPRRAALLLACVWGATALAGAATRRNHAATTRADLEMMRRRVERLEGEAALTGTRKPYVVLDLAERTLRFRLMGMTLREAPIAAFEAWGLVSSRRGGASPGTPSSLAGIVSLQVKDGDPRLSPLTPEQIEAGLDDENAVDALPPEPPARYSVRFSQPVVLRVEGAAGPGGGVLAALGSFWHGLGRGGGPKAKPAALHLLLRLDGETAREIYRSLVPGERFIIVPPPGLLLPEAGQEAPRSIRPTRPAPRPTPPPAGPPGVPFQIPPPVESEQGGPAPGSSGGGLEPPAPAGTAPEPAPAQTVEPGTSAGPESGLAPTTPP